MSEKLKILILRMSSAGDIIHGLPVAKALKDNLNDCEITWLVEDRFADLLKNNPAIDHIQVIPRKEWQSWTLWSKARETGRIVKNLRAMNFDISIDLQGLTKSAIAGKFSGIPKRIGFDGYEGKEISKQLNNIIIKADARHVVEKNLQLLKALDIDNIKPAFPLPEMKCAKIDNFLKENDLEDKKFIIVNPGAGWGAKLWTVERFAEAVSFFQKEINEKVIITWGGQSEKNMAEEILSHSGDNALLAPDTDLLELWDLLSRAKFYLGCDTGPTHMAAACGVAVLALFGPTSGERNGPYGENICEVVQGECPQHPLCWKKKYRNLCTCMLQISAENVIQKSREMLMEINKC